MGSYGDQWLMCNWSWRWGKCRSRYFHGEDFAELTGVDGIGVLCNPCLEAPLPPEQPKVGDIVGFGHPDWPNVKHRFYIAFPCGRQVRPAECFVNTRHGVQVLEVATAAFDRWSASTWGRAPNRLTAWTRANDQVDVYVGIRFLDRNRRMLWTNWSKNEQQWVHSVYDAGVLREPPVRTR